MCYTSVFGILGHRCCGMCWAQERLLRCCALMMFRLMRWQSKNNMVLRLQETGEHNGQMTNGKPPGLRARRPRGGRDRRPARDKAAEESTDGTGDGQEGAGGQRCITISGHSRV